MKHWYRDTVFSHIAQPYYEPTFHKNKTRVCVCGSGGEGV